MAELVSDYSEKKDNVFTDMVLTVEGKEFHVCKTTLASFSEYCRIIFFGKWSDSKKPTHELPDVTAHQFQLALDLLFYKIEVTANNVEDLLAVGTFLEMKDVVKRCQQALSELTPDGKQKLNISKDKKIILADRFGLTELLDHILQSSQNLEFVQKLVPKVTGKISDSNIAKITERLNALKLEKERIEAKQKAEQEKEAKRRAEWERREEERRQQGPPPERYGNARYDDDYRQHRYGNGRDYYRRYEDRPAYRNGRHDDDYRRNRYGNAYDSDGSDDAAEDGNGAGGLEAAPPRVEQLEQDAPAQRPPRAQHRQASS